MALDDGTAEYERLWGEGFPPGWEVVTLAELVEGDEFQTSDGSHGRVDEADADGFVWIAWHDPELGRDMPARRYDPRGEFDAAIYRRAA